MKKVKELELEFDTTPEQDSIFVKVYLQNGDAVNACSRAGILIYGYDLRDVAEEMLKRPAIKLALKTAKDFTPSEIGVDITRESIITDLGRIHDSAIRAGEYAPAISAKKLQAQLIGVLTENVQVNHRIDLLQMSDEKILELIELKTRNSGVIIDQLSEKAQLTDGTKRTIT